MSTWDRTIIVLLTQWASGDASVLPSLINAWFHRPFDDE